MPYTFSLVLILDASWRWQKGDAYNRVECESSYHHLEMRSLRKVCPYRCFTWFSSALKISVETLNSMVASTKSLQVLVWSISESVALTVVLFDTLRWATRLVTLAGPAITWWAPGSAPAAPTADGPTPSRSATPSSVRCRRRPRTARGASVASHPATPSASSAIRPSPWLVHRCSPVSTTNSGPTCHPLANRCRPILTLSRIKSTCYVSNRVVSKQGMNLVGCSSLFLG